MGLGGIFETIATLGTASAAKTAERFPVDLAPKPIGGPVVAPEVGPPTQGEVNQIAQGLLLILRGSRGVKPEAATQLAIAMTAVCGPQSTLSPEQQGQAVNEILSSSPAVDKAAVPELYALISMFVAQQPVAKRREAQRHRGRRVIGESIFGNFVFANDALPQQVEQPWSTHLPHSVTADVAEPVTPRGMSGFGEDVPVDHAIPTGMKWLGHGIMGGRTRHGGYATSRYGEPVTGYGMGAYNPTSDKLAVGTGPGGAFQGNQGCRMPGPTGVSTWPAAWACNKENFKEMLKVADSYRPSSQKIDDPGGWYPREYIDAVLAGKLPPPEGFPPVALQRSSPGQINVGITPSPPPPPTMAFTGSVTSGPGIAVGVGLLALIGGAILMAKKKKGASSAPVKAA